jgi:hypothetical protein
MCTKLLEGNIFFLTSGAATLFPSIFAAQIVLFERLNHSFSQNRLSPPHRYTAPPVLTEKPKNLIHRNRFCCECFKKGREINQRGRCEKRDIPKRESENLAQSQ